MKHMWASHNSRRVGGDPQFVGYVIRKQTLKELGEMMNPPVGKSGVNHRLRKLGRIADELRGNKEDYND